MNASDLCSAVRQEIRSCALFDAPSRPALPPPHDPDAERIVLLALFGGRLGAVDSGLRPESFFAPAHQALFAGMLAAEEMAIALTPLRAVRLLEGQGGRRQECAEAVAEITGATPWVHNVDRHVERVRKLARQREIIALMEAVDGAWRLGLDGRAEDLETLCSMLGVLR